MYAKYSYNSAGWYVAITGNTYPVKEQLKALGGKWDADAKAWMVPANVAGQAQGLVLGTGPKQAAPTASTIIPGLGAIFELLSKAKAGKYPTIILTPEYGPAIQLVFYAGNTYTAGAGKVNVKTNHADWTMCPYIGTIYADGGMLVVNPLHPDVDLEAAADLLLAFAKDPAGVAAQCGKTSNRCVFCRIKLTDPKSKDVGYGETCASNYGLPWGGKLKTEFACLGTEQQPNVLNVDLE